MFVRSKAARASGAPSKQRRGLRPALRLRFNGNPGHCAGVFFCLSCQFMLIRANLRPNTFRGRGSE
ncbi:hypothetical protein [Pseudomonas phage vB_Pa-PAC1]